jgi:hypothetical protein
MFGAHAGEYRLIAEMRHKIIMEETMHDRRDFLRGVFGVSTGTVCAACGLQRAMAQSRPAGAPRREVSIAGERV